MAEFSIRDGPCRAVSAIPLGDGVGVTFIEVPAGWRFHGWQWTASGEPVPFAPTEEDQWRYFATAQAAIDHFRQQYGERLRGG